jgi:hypothetical protein
VTAPRRGRVTDRGRRATTTNSFWCFADDGAGEDAIKATLESALPALLAAATILRTLARRGR